MLKHWKIFLLIFIFYVENFEIVCADEPCKIHLDIDLFNKTVRAPILVKFDKPEYEYPSKKNPGIIEILQGKKLRVFCPGETDKLSLKYSPRGKLKISDKILKPERSIETIQCQKNDEFLLNDNSVVYLKKISCHQESKVYQSILQKTNRTCGTGTMYQIGYDLGNDTFLETINLCHDNISKPFWVHTELIPANQENYRQAKGSVQKEFKVASLYQGLGMTAKDGPYKFVQQFESMKLADDDDEISKKFLTLKQRLDRGHLIARADKFYKSEQDSTYFYANVVPMWLTINRKSGNWYYVEEYLRNRASQKDSKLDVWAGGIGSSELEDFPDKIVTKGIDSKDGKLFILGNKIPVPRVLFKCAVHKKFTKALCFFVVNNPYRTKNEIEAAGKKYIVCKVYTPCQKLDFLKKNDGESKKSKGYFYCCKLDDFLKGEFEEKLNLEVLEEFKNYKPLVLE